MEAMHPITVERLKINKTLVETCFFMVIPDLRGCPPMSLANYIYRWRSSLERLINVDFGKKYKFPVFFNSAEENCNNDRENDHASFNQINELIGYHNSADFCEIWPEHTSDVVKPKSVGDF